MAFDAGEVLMHAALIFDQSASARSVRDAMDKGVAPTVKSAGASHGKTYADAFAKDADFSALKTKIADLGKNLQTARAKVDVDDKDARAKLAAFNVIWTKLSRDTATPRIDMTGFASAEARALALDAAMHKAGTDTDQAGASANRAGLNFVGASRGMYTLIAVAAGLGPALIPIGASLAAIALGAGSAFAAAAAPITVFGLTVKAQLSGIVDGYKQIQTLQKQAAAAPPGSAAQADALRKLALAQADYTKTFGPAAAGMKNLQDAWDKWKASTSGSTLPLLAQGMNLLAAALPKLRPLFDTGAQAAQRFLNAIQGWVKSGGLDQAIARLNTLAQAVLPHVESTITNVIRTAAPFAPMMADLGIKVAAGIDKATGSMAAWAASKGPGAMNSFLAYVQANGPKVFGLLENLAVAAVQIVRALSPMAPVSLAVANALAKLIASLPPGAIQAIVVAVIAWSGAMNVLGLASGNTGKAIAWLSRVSGLTGGLKALGTALKESAAAQWLLNASILGCPVTWIIAAIAALGVGFYIAWEKSALFRDIMKDIAKVMLSVGIVFLQAVKGMVDGFLSFVGTVINGAAKAFGWVPGLGPKLKGAAKAFNDMRDDVDGAFNRMIGNLQGWQRELDGSKTKSGEAAKSITADFGKQAKAAADARSDLDAFSTAITRNGQWSSAAQDARNKLANDLTKAGVNATTAQADVDRYSAAVAANGVKSQQAQQAREILIKDILDASGNAKAGQTDMTNLAAAIRLHGTTSNQYNGARATLIMDLKNTGMNAADANKLVDGLTNSIRNEGATSDFYKGSRGALIGDLKGAGLNSKDAATLIDTLTRSVQNQGTTSDSYKFARAVLIADLEKSGKTSQEATSLVDGLTGAIQGVPGSKNVNIVMNGDGSYTITGLGPRAIAGGPAQLAPLPPGKAAGGMITGGIRGMDSVIGLLMPGEVVVPEPLVRAGAVDHLRGILPGFAGGGLVSTGNTAILSGAAIDPMYRDWETQYTQAMVNKMRAALAASEAAAIKTAAAAAAATASAGATAAGVLSKQQIAGYWTGAGGPGGTVAQIAAAITGGESGFNPNAIQAGQPPGLTGYGLWQITPTSGIWQNGAFGNLLAPTNNARAAVYLYHQAGDSFRPWVVYNTGAYLKYMNAGGLVGAGYAAGTGSAAPGWGWVGEEGPELVRFRGGETIYDAATSAAAAAGGGNTSDSLLREIRALHATLNDLPARIAGGVSKAVTAPQQTMIAAARAGAR